MRPLARNIVFFALTFGFVATCSLAEGINENEHRRIVSLDFCADQYLMGLASPQDIAALSPDATASFSYLRDQARTFSKVRPRAEDLLLLNPDIVIRTYGGGPNITHLLERVGIRVIQIPYATDLDSIRRSILSAAKALDDLDRGHALIRAMDSKIHSVRQHQADDKVLYLTSKGAVAGAGTLIDELIDVANAENFQTKAGWGALSLERLAYERPDYIAAAFFGGADERTDKWSPTHHPVARRALKSVPIIDIDGASTACGGWFVLDAAEAIANRNEAMQ
ncbi:MAG: ABC transporter substrate-binding protein [Pseudomonadota bacterium]